MNRKPQAIRLSPSTRARRARWRQRWQAWRPWLEDAAALLFLAVGAGAWFGLLVMLAPRA